MKQVMFEEHDLLTCFQTLLSPAHDLRGAPTLSSLYQSTSYDCVSRAAPTPRRGRSLAPDSGGTRPDGPAVRVCPAVPGALTPGTAGQIACSRRLDGILAGKGRS